ncbi:MAG TPA: O-antigen ligase family protein [Solirubrobacterales bacterium]|nr:O-antigen ligase family protein [Solirubrobacterales bacterium]
MNALQRMDSWPRTRRPLPWIFALFLASIFLLPIDATQLKVHLPFSSEADRFFAAFVIVAWAITALMAKRSGRLRLRPRGWATAFIVFFAIAIISLAFNFDRITNLGEWETAEKKLVLLITLVGLFAVFSVSLRVTELRAFGVLIVILASITALGTIYEEKAHDNLFYSTGSTLLSPIAEVEPAPTEAGSDPSAPGRPMISGPTRHALSVASILGMAVPFAIVFAAGAPSLRRKLLWGALALLIIVGALITQRRSGLIVPAVAILTLFAIRPRQFLPLIPVALVAIVVGFAIKGGSISVISQLTGGENKASDEGRTSDYEAVVPDVLTHPAIGRGYGTLDSQKVDTYRIFDNEYLGELYQTGLLGLLAFIALILTPVVIAVRYAARRDNPLRGPPALAAAAGIMGFFVAAALYDILTFPQAPYLFLFLAAMCTTAASVEKVAPERARRARPRRRGAPQRRRRGARPLANPM